MKVTLDIKKPKSANYVVKGKTIAEAAKFMRDKPYAACYKANPGYDFAKDKDGKVTSIKLKAAPTIAMPVWDGAKKLKDQEKKDWAAMMSALQKHEDNHHKKWEKAAKDWAKTAGKRDDITKDTVAGVMNDFFTKAQGVMDKYDGSTNHGEKEGVTLPY